jgi:tetratricopeptide (TPR) repeat protein
MDLLSYAQRALLVPSSTAFTTIAQIYQMRGEWNAAHSWYHRAILLEPENSTNWVYLGNYYQSLAKWDLALDAYQQAQKYGPASSAISLALGNVQEKLGRFEEAMGSYQRSIEMDPGSMDAYISLAELQLNQNDSENALATIQAGIVKVPGDYRGYMTLGEVYETIDPENVTQIEMAYQAGLDILPGESALYVRIGDLYTQRVFSAWVNLKEAGELANLSQNRYTAMLNHFGIVNEDLSQQSPFVQDTIIEQRLIVDRYKQNLGVAQAAFKETDVDFGVADSNYLKALELEPNDGLALLGLGRLQITRDAQDVAQAYFEQANAYNPSSSTLLTHLGMLYQDVGWTEQAVHVFEQLKKIEPSNISAQAGLLEGYRNLASLTVTQASQAVEERAYTLGSLVNFLRDRETQPSR